MERRKNTSANRRTCVLASGATAVVVMAGGSSAGASWTSAGTSITVSGQLTQIIVDGPPQADGHAARTETTAHVTIGEVTVDIDPRLARGALVKENAVPSAIASELTRLAPRNIVILGGPASVSSDVALALRQFVAR